MLPKQVKIGGLIYEVKVKDGPLVDGTTVLYGQAAYGDGEIRLSGAISESQRECAFWHELLHVIGFERGLKQLACGDEDEIEKLVIPLATALYAFMVDNGLRFPIAPEGD
jgi:hypothetical protein